jgi:hypothetical protein
MQTDRRKDMTKLIVAFRNSANAPKMAVNTAHLSVGVAHLNFNASIAELIPESQTLVAGNVHEPRLTPGECAKSCARRSVFLQS